MHGGPRIVPAAAVCSSCQLQEQDLFTFSIDFLHHICHYICQINETLGVLYPTFSATEIKKKYRVDFCVIQVEFSRDKNIKITIEGKKEYSQLLGVTGLGCLSQTKP